MLKAALYEELKKADLGYVLCSKEELKQKLQEFDERLNLDEDSLIIRICSEGYKIYYSQKFAEDSELIQLDLALKFRVEIDIGELQQVMNCVDEVTVNYPFDVVTDKYCLIRHMDLSDDFLIMDVYIGVAEHEKTILHL